MTDFLNLDLSCINSCSPGTSGSLGNEVIVRGLVSANSYASILAGSWGLITKEKQGLRKILEAGWRLMHRPRISYHLWGNFSNLVAHLKPGSFRGIIKMLGGCMTNFCTLIARASKQLLLPGTLESLDNDVILRGLVSANNYASILGGLITKEKHT